MYCADSPVIALALADDSVLTAAKSPVSRRACTVLAVDAAAAASLTAVLAVDCAVAALLVAVLA